MIQKAIIKYLEDKGIKQSFLSYKTGLSTGAISAILRGKQKLLIDDYIAICKALDVSLQFFIDNAA